MALTLAQYSKIETMPLRKGIIENLLRNSRIMHVLPWENVDSLSSIAVRWTNLPSVAFRKVNAGYTPSEGDTDSVWESVFGLGGEIKFDRVFSKVKNTIVDPKVLHIKMKTEALALTFNDYFFNGDHATDADGFEGLKKRVENYPARQKVPYAAAGGAGLDPTASTTNARKLFDGLEEQHYKTGKGEGCDAIFCNEGIMYGIGKVARYAQIAGGAFLDVTKDSYDRQILTYKGAPLIDAGLKTDQSTEIITATEAGGDAATNTTSIYMCKWGIEQGITGIQLGPLEVYDPLDGGEQEASPTKLVRMEWWVGLAGFGSYGITRGWNLKSTPNWT